MKLGFSCFVQPARSAKERAATVHTIGVVFILEPPSGVNAPDFGSSQFLKKRGRLGFVKAFALSDGLVVSVLFIHNRRRFDEKRKLVASDRGVKRFTAHIG